MQLDRRAWLTGAVALGAFGASPAAAAPLGLPIGKLPIGGGPHAKVESALRAYMARHLAAWGLPGMTLSMVDADGYAASLTVGQADLERRQPVRPTQLFQIGSISKSFAAVAVLKAVEEGRLSLDEVVGDRLPALRLPREILVRHLVEHSSGLPDNAPLLPRGHEALWIGHPAGAKHSYSNTGYQILGLLLEAVERKPYGQVIGERILAPLGMASTAPIIRLSDRPQYAVGYQPYLSDRPFPRAGRLAPAPWLEFDNAAGSIGSTPGDMAKYLAWVLRAGRGDGAPILNPASARLFTSPWIDAPDWGEGAKYGAGLATLQVDKRPLLHHTGGMLAFSSSMHLDVEAGVAAFASTNANVRGYRPRLVTLYACRLLRALKAGKGAAPAEIPPIPSATEIPKAVLPDFPGTYRSAAGETFSLVERGDGLAVLHAGEEARLESRGPDAALAPLPRFSRFPLVFRREAGKVAGAWYGDLWFGKDGRTDAPGTVPAELQALAGRYDNDDPWQGTFRLVARPDGLYLDGTERLLALQDGLWTVAEGSPERIRLDGFIDGKAQRMNLSGVDFLRRPDDA
jgi:CubicO group peptidase (beta-lactamase class C family)